MTEQWTTRIVQLDNDYIARIFHLGVSDKALHSSIHKTEEDAIRVTDRALNLLKTYYQPIIEDQIKNGGK